MHLTLKRSRIYKNWASFLTSCFFLCSWFLAFYAAAVCRRERERESIGWLLRRDSFKIKRNISVDNRQLEARWATVTERWHSVRQARRLFFLLLLLSPSSLGPTSNPPCLIHAVGLPRWLFYLFIYFVLFSVCFIYISFDGTWIGMKLVNSVREKRDYEMHLCGFFGKPID